MEELYSIMRDLLEVAYHQKSLLYLLMAAEAGYISEDEHEVKLMADSTKYYLTALQDELNTAISRMDTYVAENVHTHKK